jgi:hypothetical protein
LGKAKKCRVLKSAHAPAAPRAAHVQKKKVPGGLPAPGGPAGKPAAATNKSKVHHAKHKKHHARAKKHKTRVCGG